MVSLFILTRLEAKELNFIASENEGKVLLTDYWWKFKELQVFLGKIWQWILKTTQTRNLVMLFAGIIPLERTNEQ